MSHSVFETIDQAAFIEDQIHGSERISEPSKKWRARFKVVSACFERSRLNRVLEPGEIILSAKLYPSAEVAEQKFIDCMARNTKRFAACIEYLGAFPE